MGFQFSQMLHWIRRRLLQQQLNISQRLLLLRRQWATMTMGIYWTPWRSKKMAHPISLTYTEPMLS